MQAKRGEKMIQAERILFFQPEREIRFEWNPEEDATNNLLQISNQEHDFFDEQVSSHLYKDEEEQHLKLKKHDSTLSERQPKLMLGRREGRAAFAQGLARSQKNWHKSSVNYLSGEEVCVMRKQRVVNLANFLIFQNQELANISAIADNKFKLEEIDLPRPVTKSKNTKVLMNFIRKRNLNFTREPTSSLKQEKASSPSYRIGSPVLRINQSCELKRQKQQCIKPIFNQLSSTRAELSHSPENRSTSPSFRNKKVLNYFKYRLTKNPQSNDKRA